MNHQELAAELSRLGLKHEAEVEARVLLDRVSAEQLNSLATALARAPEVDDAYRLLGEEAGPGAWGSDTLRAGKEAFLRSRDRIRHAVCGSAVIYDMCRRPSLQNSTTAAAILLGVLVGANVSGVSLPLIATLVLRSGTDEFCSPVWSKGFGKSL